MKAKLLQAGQKFGKLTVVKLDRIKQKVYNSEADPSRKRISNERYYLCKCDCGKYKSISVRDLTRKRSTKSCGCANGTHHKTKTRLYKIWSGMKKRCENKNSKSFYYYGGRGISVCENWSNDFVYFYEWSISNGYKENLSIDRIDNNKGYSPENCRWITMKDQQQNKRGMLLLEHNGEVKTVSQWAEEMNIYNKTLYSGLKRKLKKYVSQFKIVGKI